tara:strand:+ start:544 stop:1476 length:933 start_codon:yes stop_codon:yes gene_type:complete
MKQLHAFLFSLILAPLSFGQNVGEVIKSPDMKRFLQSHTLDLKKDFGGWITETSERKIKYGDWSCFLRNKVLWCDGYWDKITIKSNPFELVNKTGEVSSVVLKSQKRDPRIPSDTPRVDVAKMETKFISPYLDLSLNNNDKLEFEYRVSSVNFFSFLVILSDEEGGQVLHEFYPPRNTGVPHPSTEYEKITIDLDADFKGCPSCPFVPIRQSRKAVINIIVNYSSDVRSSTFELRNVISPPQFLHEPMQANAKLDLAKENGVNVIRWDKGILESALLPYGPWSAVNKTTSPYSFLANKKQQFFRLRATLD